MNRIEDYMNDPDIANEPMPLREIHAIRLTIQDETRGMSPAELRAYYENHSKKHVKNMG